MVIAELISDALTPFMPLNYVCVCVCVLNRYIYVPIGKLTEGQTHG